MGSLRTVFVRLLGGLLLLVLIDSLMFRTGWYFEWLEPDSSTAYYEHILRAERARVKTGARQVLVVGDSHTGFLPRIANEYAAAKGLQFASGALGGTTPRCWYYLLRALDPQADIYDALLVPFEDYEDEDLVEDYANRTLDLNYIIGRLHWSDAPAYVLSHNSWESRWYATRAVTLKGFVLKRDLQSLLADRKGRKQRIGWYEQWPEWVYNFKGDVNSLEGLVIDWKTRKVTIPAGVSPKVREMLEQFVQREPEPANGLRSRYLHQWIGRIVAHYAGSKTRIIFFRLPRGPFPRPASLRSTRGSVARELSALGVAVLAPEDLMIPLEQPRLFVDPMHMNGEGMATFSRMLADLALSVVGRN